MIDNKKEFYGGAILLAIFFIVLIIMFQPIFGGTNAMHYLDQLYNSISKGSVYYIPEIRPEVEALKTMPVELELKYADETVAEQSVTLFEKAGATVRREGNTLAVSGTLGGILDASLSDADSMYYNRGSEVENRYGVKPRRAAYNWWTSLKLIDKNLGKQGEFSAAKTVTTVNKKAVETAYNYYGIESLHITDRLGTVIFSLVFYVIYTLWYGFAILFLFEGWGLRLSH